MSEQEKKAFNILELKDLERYKMETKQLDNVTRPSKKRKTASLVSASSSKVEETPTVFIKEEIPNNNSHRSEKWKVSSTLTGERIGMKLRNGELVKFNENNSSDYLQDLKEDESSENEALKINERYYSSEDDE